MDFYFGDANMSKSKFLSQEIAAKGPWLNLETFLKFNKLAEILRQGFEGRLETNDLWAALSNATSDVWEIREIEVDQNESRYVLFVSNSKAGQRVQVCFSALFGKSILLSYVKILA